MAVALSGSLLSPDTATLTIPPNHLQELQSLRFGVVAATGSAAAPPPLHQRISRVVHLGVDILAGSAVTQQELAATVTLNTTSHVVDPSAVLRVHAITDSVSLAATGVWAQVRVASSLFLELLCLSYAVTIHHDRSILRPHWLCHSPLPMTT